MAIYMRLEFQPITTPWIYHNEELWLISLSSDGTNWITITDKNLWATQVYHSWDTLAKANRGLFYQRWNNYGFDVPVTKTSWIQVSTSGYWPWNYYSSDTFIATREDWSYPKNNNLWWDTTDTLEARRWPCDEWYHVPSRTDAENLLSTVKSATWISNFYAADFATYLLMPTTWYINYYDYSLYVTAYMYYWTSSYSRLYDTQAYTLFANASSSKTNSWTVRANGVLIRPFKNEAVQPNTSWTIIYQ